MLDAYSFAADDSTAMELFHAVNGSFNKIFLRSCGYRLLGLGPTMVSLGVTLVWSTILCTPVVRILYLGVVTPSVGMYRLWRRLRVYQLSRGSTMAMLTSGMPSVVTTVLSYASISPNPGN